MFSVQNKRKRQLISPSACIPPKIAKRTSALLLRGTTGERECGRLVTVDAKGTQGASLLLLWTGGQGRERRAYSSGGGTVLVIELARPFTIGRGAMCDYQTVITTGIELPSVELTNEADSTRCLDSPLPHLCCAFLPPFQLSHVLTGLDQLTADGGEVVVCLEDQSTNGTMWNDRRIHRQVVLLLDGDRIEIGGQLFRYSHRSEHGQPSSQATQDPIVEKQQVGHYLVLAVTLGT